MTLLLDVQLTMSLLLNIHYISDGQVMANVTEHFHNMPAQFARHFADD